MNSLGSSSPDERPVRVLQVIKSLGLGGAERLLVSAVRAGDMGRIHYEVAYAVEAENSLVPELEGAGVRTWWLGSRNHYALKWGLKLRRLLAAQPFDVVHFHLPYAAVVGRLVVRSLPKDVRPRVVYTQHNVWRHTAFPVRVLNRLTLSLDDAVLAVSEMTRLAMPPRPRRRAEVVVHGLPIEEVREQGAHRAETRAELEVADDEILVVTIANFRREKGYGVLLRAAKELLDEGLPVRFVAIGHGPEERHIREEHEALGLGPRFLLLGFRPDALRYVAASDLFVLASLHEGLPVAIMEALALGVPVVATAVGAIPDAIGNGAGMVVPPNRPNLLADAMRRLTFDTAARAAMAEGAREAGRRYDIRVAVQRLETLYRDLASARRTRADA